LNKIIKNIWLCRTFVEIESLWHSNKHTTPYIFRRNILINVSQILHTFHKHDSNPFASTAAQIFPKIALGNELARATRMKQSGVITLISKLCIKLRTIYPRPRARRQRTVIFAPFYRDIELIYRGNNFLLAARGEPYFCAPRYCGRELSASRSLTKH